MKKFKKRLEKLENIVKSLSPATLNNPLNNQVNAMHNPQSSEIRGFSLKFGNRNRKNRNRKPKSETEIRTEIGNELGTQKNKKDKGACGLN